MGHLVAIAFGGAAGALLRYWVSNGALAWFGRGFPWGTFIVNVAGSFAMGCLYVVFVERASISAEWRLGLLTGLLGALTTFSTFSMETLVLLEAGRVATAALNILASVVLCLAACWGGVVLGRALT